MLVALEPALVRVILVIPVVTAAVRASPRRRSGAGALVVDLEIFAGARARVVKQLGADRDCAAVQIVASENKDFIKLFANKNYQAKILTKFPKLFCCFNRTKTV